MTSGQIRVIKQGCLLHTCNLGVSATCNFLVWILSWTLEEPSFILSADINLALRQIKLHCTLSTKRCWFSGSTTKTYSRFWDIVTFSLLAIAVILIPLPSFWLLIDVREINLYTFWLSPLSHSWQVKVKSGFQGGNWNTRARALSICQKMKESHSFTVCWHSS